MVVECLWLRIESNLINKDWNALNILTQNASTVGLLDLNILSDQKGDDFNFFQNAIFSGYNKKI